MPATLVLTDAEVADLVQLRRELHQHPELGLELPWTQERLLPALAPLDLEISTGKSSTSITAVLRGNRRGRSVLLRADMDALPVQEDSGLDYASQEEGRMHACGHDLHMAALVGAARLLHGIKDELAGDVVLMLQPGEEGFDGASHMIAEGVLGAAGQRAEAAYGLHVLSAGLPNGVVGTRPGALMAAADALRVTVRGRGGHGSAPHQAADPVTVMAEMITAIQTMVTRRIDVFDPAVVSVGTVHAGTQRNIIPSTACFEATLRTYSQTTRNTLRSGLTTLLEGIAAAYGVSVDVEHQDEYPPTVNNADEAAFALTAARSVVGEGRVVEMEKPLAASEDFSRVLDEIPGAFLLLGASVPAQDGGEPAFNHSPQALFDDAVLGDAASLLAELARQRLRRA